MPVTEEKIRDALSTVKYPGFSRDIVSFGLVKNIAISGADVTVVEYLQSPPTRAELTRLYNRAGMTAREGLRAKEPLATELGLNDPETSEEAILDAMMAHPILINRPLVETDKGVKLCRPQDEVRSLL